MNTHAQDAPVAAGRSQTRILSLWLPRFATDRLMREEERPRVLIRPERGRQVLAAVDRHAAELGLEPGMALADARALEPGIAVSDWQAEEDARALADLAAWCVRYTPLVALDPSASCLSGVLGGDAALWLDVTGCAHLFGGPDLHLGEEALCADLLNRLAGRGISAHVGLADTAGAAWAVARFGPSALSRSGSSGGNGIVASGHQERAIARLPLTALRLPPATVEALARTGIRTVGALLDLPRGPLTARFGGEVSRRIDQALGRLDEPLSPLAPPSPYRVRLGLPEPIAERDAIEGATHRLLNRIHDRLEREQAGIRRARIAYFRTDGEVRTLNFATGRPVRDPEVLFRLITEKLDGLDPGYGIDVLILEALRVEPIEVVQRDLAGPRAGGGAGAEEAVVDALLDRIANRLGEERVTRPILVESHLPERAERRAPTLSGTPIRTLPPAPGSRAPGSHVPSPHAPSPHAPSPHVPIAARPIRMLVRPEPVEAMALLPDHPPARFKWRGVDYRVARAAGPERIAPEWWEADAHGHRSRDYFRIEDTGGRRFWLYREGLAERGEAPRWMMHGLMG
jgi:protein ImuB